MFLKFILSKGDAEIRFEFEYFLQISYVCLILKFRFDVHFSVFSGLNPSIFSSFNDLHENAVSEKGKRK